MGLSRTSLSEILDETDPATGEKCVVSLLKMKTGAKRGLRLINKQSLLGYLQRMAATQNGLRWADRITNPHRYELDEVFGDRELFGLCLGPDNLVTDEDWAAGKLSSRRGRLMTLGAAGVLVRDS